ncbi:MAG: hypothetical protein QOD42_1811 [Sphingomonadales bacterium]|jgi:hypothetical protein|nr:hypothetical protein [Sphingomonadales bacterium]
MERGLKALVPERMTETAYERLYEAVNTGRLIGFVGSGLSLVYGNLTWEQFVKEVIERLKAQLEPLPKGFEQLAQRIRAELVAIECERDDTVIVLEFVRQAFKVVDQSQRAQPDTAFKKALGEIFESDKVFVTNALAQRLRMAGIELGEFDKKVDTTKKKDDSTEPDFFAEAQVRKEIDLANVSIRDALYMLASDVYDTRAIIGLAGAAEGDPDAFNTLFGPDSVEGASSRLRKRQWIQKALAVRVEADRQRRSSRLPTDRRSFFALFLARVVMKDGKARIDNVLPRVGDQAGDLAPPRPLLDPLNELYHDLGIRRYFTTNYDFDIENLFMFDDVREIERMPVSAEDRESLFARPDFARTLDGAALTRHRPDGVRVRSDVNDGKHTAPLVEFGLGSSDHAIHIFHHHGRVDLPKTMIAADGEYNLMYRADGLNRQSLDRAYDAMIEGNPIAFLGSGMNEEELIRTLRMRISNKRSPLDAPVFVFRAATKPPASLMREQLNLATKLGAHVIHYGHTRRGTGYSLRTHFMMIDILAERFQPDDARKHAAVLAQYQEWTPNIALGDSNEEVLEKKKLIELLDKAATKKAPDTLRQRFRYIWELDFDRHLIPWLIGTEGTRFARQVKTAVKADLKHAPAPLGPRSGAPIEATDQNRGLRARALALDYLRSLSVRLNTSALRHELRQINRESKKFYHRKARALMPRRAGTLAGAGKKEWSRHLTPDDFWREQEAWLPKNWHWVRLGSPRDGLAGEADHAADGAAVYAKLLDQRQQGPLLREVVIGERGTRKGSFLQQLQVDLRNKRDDWLIANCCYGQEADSILSLVDAFLNNSAGAEASAARRPRRLRILDYADATRRPLIVLGAVDRLFGIENEPLLAEFDWLLRHLLRPETCIDLVITASRRCEAYFLKLRETSPNPSISQAGVEGGKSAISIYRVHPVLPAGKPERSLDDQIALEPLGRGLVVRLHDQFADRERAWLREDVHEVGLRMAHRPRNAPLIVGREIEALLSDMPTKQEVAEQEKQEEQERQAGKKPTEAKPRLRVGRLSQEILKALAFIGLPTEGEVLMSVPGVRRELDRLLSGEAGKRLLVATSPRPSSAAELLDESRATDTRAHFLAALDHAMDRNLLCVVEPYGEAANPVVAAAPSASGAGDPLATGVAPSRAKTAIAKRYRFVLHRVVNQTIRDRFDVPVSETVLSDSYNLSLYAAQPDDAPAFKPELTSDIEQLADNLINCWKDVTLCKELAEPVKKLRDQLLSEEIYSANALIPDLLLRTKRFARTVQFLDPAVTGGLRAAGGVIRGFFSAVNLLALDLGDPGGKIGDVGVISAHKARIRRLLDFALESEAARKDFRNQIAGTAKKAFKDRLEHIFDVQVWSPLLPGDKPVSASRRNGGAKPGSDVQLAPHSRQLLWDRSVTPKDKFEWPDSSGVALDTWKQLRKVTGTLLSEPSPKLLREPIDRLLVLPDSAGDAGHAEPAALLNTEPFYSEEIVWLLNERAMLSLAQGDLYAAATGFELAFNANMKVEGRTRYYPVRCRLLLNRSLLWIERGKITEARRCLNELHQGLGATRDALSLDYREGKLVHALAIGYLGLCDQLNGFMKRAETAYRTALHKLNQLREQRAIAIFEFHLGSLLHQANRADGDEAAACFTRAIAAAEGGRHTDILYRVRIGQAHNARMRGKLDAAASRSILARAIEYGDKLDMHRVAVEALSASIQLRLELGDVDAASHDCKRALALASQYGMTLRRIWLRVMTGKVYLARNDLPNAEFMFERAIEAAERVGFQRAIEVASTNLMSIPGTN